VYEQYVMLAGKMGSLLGPRWTSARTFWEQVCMTVYGQLNGVAAVILLLFIIMVCSYT
jgi:hypothetical protein